MAEQSSGVVRQKNRPKISINMEKWHSDDLCDTHCDSQQCKVYKVLRSHMFESFLNPAHATTQTHTILGRLVCSESRHVKI